MFIKPPATPTLQHMLYHSRWKSVKPLVTFGQWVVMFIVTIVWYSLSLCFYLLLCLSLSLWGHLGHDGWPHAQPSPYPLFHGYVYLYIYNIQCILYMVNNFTSIHLPIHVRTYDSSLCPYYCPFHVGCRMLGSFINTHMIHLCVLSIVQFTLGAGCLGPD